MNILLDLAPVAVFFIAYKLAGIDVAVIALMVAMPLCVGLMHFAPRKPGKVNYATVALVLVLGAFTLSFDDPLFIKLKPTVLYAGLALALALALLLKRNPLAAILGPALGKVPASSYARLGWQWVVLMLAVAAANLVVVEHMSESAWVNFKTFAIPLFIFATLIVQILLVGRKYGFASQEGKQQV